MRLRLKIFVTFCLLALLGCDETDEKYLQLYREGVETKSFATLDRTTYEIFGHERSLEVRRSGGKISHPWKPDLEFSKHRYCFFSKIRFSKTGEYLFIPYTYGQIAEAFGSKKCALIAFDLSKQKEVWRINSESCDFAVGEQR